MRLGVDGLGGVGVWRIEGFPIRQVFALHIIANQASRKFSKTGDQQKQATLRNVKNL